MAMFLIDNDKSYSYDDLLQSLNISSEYCPLYKTSDIYSYFVNLIKALAANKPLVLLDSDLNPAEIDGVDEHLVNVKEGIAKKSYMSMDEIVEAIQNSNSEITIFTS